MSGKTHWRKLHNPDYLGAYALEPGKDMILTIKTAANEMVTGADGKKEECMVLRFVEPEKPMIVNVTNAKTIEKIYKTPYIEEWAGKQIQLYVAKIKAFGETLDALRIRPFVPKPRTAGNDTVQCTDCGDAIGVVGGRSPAAIAKYTHEKYGRPLCGKCAEKAAMQSDPLAATATTDVPEGVEVL
jgi:hypothetical protein